MYTVSRHWSRKPDEKHTGTLIRLVEMEMKTSTVDTVSLAAFDRCAPLNQMTDDVRYF